ncbi:MAG TPA: hypothetical protein VHH15_12925 [Actinophytocola sp.]|nr:hypothetical protein [Actinophytocola sp.]
MDQGIANARILLDRWDSTRRTASTDQEADADFRYFLMDTMPEELNPPGQPLDEDRRAHWYSIACTMRLCVELGRFADGLLLARWLAEEYVPFGDGHAESVIRLCGDCCLEVSRVPELFEQATELLWWMASRVPRDAEPPLARAHCQALVTIAVTHRDNNTQDTYYQRTHLAIAVFRDVIDRWFASDDPELRGNVAYAMTQRAIALSELGDEPAARQQFGRALDSHRDAMLPPERDIARHAADVLDTIDFPEPAFRTDYLDAMDRKNRRAGRRSEESAGAVRVARHRHEVSRRTIRSYACLGIPMVLLLRNFDLAQTATVTTNPSRRFDLDEPEGYGVTMRFRAGSPLVDRLAANTQLVTVTSTAAGSLEADRLSGDFGTPHFRLALALSDDDWLAKIRELIPVAELIVVWAEEKTPGLLDELNLLTMMGREADTVVLLEGHRGPEPERAAMFGERRASGSPLAPNDPVLARFPSVMRVEDVVRPDPGDSPFVRAVTDPLEVVSRLPTEERVARIRARVDTARRH